MCLHKILHNLVRVTEITATQSNFQNKIKLKHLVEERDGKSNESCVVLISTSFSSSGNGNYV